MKRCREENPSKEIKALHLVGEQIVNSKILYLSWQFIDVDSDLWENSNGMTLSVALFGTNIIRQTEAFPVIPANWMCFPTAGDIVVVSLRNWIIFLDIIQ